MQSRRRSAVEAVTGTVTGFLGSLLITLVVLHYVDDKPTAAVLSTGLCTVWSLVRGYTIRRIFARRDE